MNYKSILYEKRHRIGRIILSRPDASNAIDCDMAVELFSACGDIGYDEEVRVVVIGGGDAFSVGIDRVPGPDLSRLLAQVASAVDALACLEVPVIAALNGPVLDEGLELALACDVRVASQGAELGLRQIKEGRIPTCGGTQRLPRIIGRGKAVEMILTGDVIGAGEAYRVGLVNGVAPSGEALAAAEELAVKIARNAPIAARYAKEAILKGLDRPLDQGMRLEADLSVILQTTADRAEGLRSFLKRRTPEYKGK
ncbi:MAG: enoyl-CoA hydratase/isomerase family protein [Chloroflexi bacterium]|nr:enoyl-CoA hydratase/isomerase family protein [Chloroflexota bacterium]